MIPEEAVEAAAMAIYEVNGAGESGYELADYRRDARAALEAATPFIAAQVWDEGAVAGWKQSGEGFNSEYPDESTGECSVDLSANPYRQGWAQNG